MIGRRIKELRIKNGLKQQELADMFGCIKCVYFIL